MLRWRLLLGTLFIAAVAGLCWLDARSATPGVWLFPLALLVAVGASGELLWMTSGRPLAAAVYLGNVAIVGANWLPAWQSEEAWGRFGWPSVALALAVIGVFAGEMRRYEKPGGVTERLALAVFSLVYVGLMLTFVIQLRFLGSGPLGVAALASLVLVVKMCDIGAYTVGRLIGRHRMSPVLSPGKTVEGAIGGLVFATAGAWLALRLVLPALVPTSPIDVPVWGWIGFGLLVGMAGMFGDLAESLLKRDLGRKDSSAWMPGYGGVLDVLDSVLLGAPVAYLGWAILLRVL
jgi:phosphatidate cytidylyltransferase